MKILKQTSNEQDRLKVIEDNQKFIIDCLFKIDDIKREMINLNSQRVERQRQEQYQLWLKQKITVEFVTNLDDKLIFKQTTDTRQYLLNRIEELINIANSNMILLERLEVYRNNEKIILFSKDLFILTCLINNGYTDIKYEDYCCKKLNIEPFSFIKADEDIKHYLYKLYKLYKEQK